MGNVARNPKGWRGFLFFGRYNIQIWKTRRQR